MTFDGVDVLGATSALDPLHKIYWIEVSSTNSSYFMFYGVNIESKTVRKVLNYKMLSTLAWDPVTKLMVGYGVERNASSWYRAVVTLDSKTEQFNQIGKRLYARFNEKATLKE